MSKIEIMIVDDHLVVREGLKQMLEIENDITVVAEAKSGMECLEILEDCEPDIIFMDIRMAGINGIETTRLVCEKYPHIKVVMLTIYEDNQYVTEAMKVGAKGYILKNVKRDDLISIVHHIAEGRAILDPKVTRAVVNYLAKENSGSKRTEEPHLTQRELEVLHFITAGHTDRKISEVMHISTHTVRSHIKSLFRKLGVSSKSQATSVALKKRIIRLD